MSLETCIVWLNEPLTTKKVEAFTRAVVDRGGRIELAATRGAFIISIDHTFIDELKAMPGVKLIGGVEIRPRKVPIIKKPLPAEEFT